MSHNSEREKNENENEELPEKFLIRRIPSELQSKNIRERKDSNKDQANVTTDEEVSDENKQDVECDLDRKEKQKSNENSFYLVDYTVLENEETLLDSYKLDDACVFFHYQNVEKDILIEGFCPTILSCFKNLRGLTPLNKIFLLGQIKSEITKEKRIKQLFPLIQKTPCKVAISNKLIGIEVVMIFFMKAEKDFTKNLRNMTIILTNLHQQKLSSQDFLSQIKLKRKEEPESSEHVNDLFKDEVKIQKSLNKLKNLPEGGPSNWTWKEKIEFICSFKEAVLYIPRETRKSLKLYLDDKQLFGENKEDPIVILPNGYLIEVFSEYSFEKEEIIVEQDKIMVFFQVNEKNDSLPDKVEYKLIEEPSLGSKWKLVLAAKDDLKKFQSLKIEKLCILCIQKNGALLIWKIGGNENILNKDEERTIIKEDGIQVKVEKYTYVSSDWERFEIRKKTRPTFVYGGYGEEEINSKKIRYLCSQVSKDYEFSGISVEDFVRMIRNKWRHIASNKSSESKDKDETFYFGFCFSVGADGKSTEVPEIFLKRILKPFPGFIRHLYENCYEKVLKETEVEMEKNYKTFLENPIINLKF